LLIFILKIKQKSGIPFLPFYTFFASLNRICPRKWLRSLMGLLSIAVFKAQFTI
jgi:hypothetical protein